MIGRLLPLIGLATGVAACVLLATDASPRSRADAGRTGDREKSAAADASREREKMSPERKAAVAELARALETEPDRDALEATMVRFARWVDTLTPAQRKRLDDAVSTTDRLAAARALIDEQRKTLEADLKRLREHELAIAEPPLGTPANNLAKSMGPDWQDRIKLLNSSMTRYEKRQRDALRLSSPRDANAYQAILAIKYAGGLPALAPAIDWTQRIVPRSFFRSEFYVRCFGGVPFEQLSTAERVRFRELLELSFSLPEVTPRMVLDAFPLNDERRSLYMQMRNDFPLRPFSLVYYFDRTKELAFDKRFRFERLQKPGSNASDAALKPDETKPTTREKAKRFFKKANGGVGKANTPSKSDGSRSGNGSG